MQISAGEKIHEKKMSGPAHRRVATQECVCVCVAKELWLPHLLCGPVCCILYPESSLFYGPAHSSRWILQQEIFQTAFHSTRTCVNPASLTHPMSSHREDCQNFPPCTRQCPVCCSCWQMRYVMKGMSCYSVFTTSSRTSSLGSAVENHLPVANKTVK